MYRKILTLLNPLVLSATLYINFLAATSGLNGRTTGEISNMNPTLFTPAGFTFSIWGIIYLLNIIFVSVQVYKAFCIPEKMDTRLSIGFLLMTMANATWMYTWHGLHYGLALLVMLLLLLLLIQTYHWLVEIRRKGQYFHKWSYTVEYLTFSTYLAWISVATIANAAVFLTLEGLSYQGTLATGLTLFVILIALGLGLWIVWKERNVWYAAVMVWAFFGIYSARIGDDSPGAFRVATVALAASIGIAITLLFYGFVLFRKRLH